MKQVFAGILVMGLCCSVAAHAQKGPQPLKLVQTIPLPGVEGRIDQMNVDAQGKRLFMAALGNQTVEIVDLAAGKRLQSLSGLEEPEGLVYVPQTKLLFVAAACS